MIVEAHMAIGHTVSALAAAATLATVYSAWGQGSLIKLADSPRQYCMCRYIFCSR